MMNIAIEKEDRISYEHACKILELDGWDEEAIEDELDPEQAYYLATDTDGDEYLMEWGQEKPIARNLPNGRSWSNPW